MPTMDAMRQGGTPLDPFLYATVGRDRNDNPVTVLSTLARLGLEPWEAATDLAGLTRDEARTRLGTALARFTDVPALKEHHVAVTHRLIDLLPKKARPRAARTTEDTLPARATGFGPVIVLLVIALYLVYSLFVGSTGTGD